MNGKPIEAMDERIKDIRVPRPRSSTTTSFRARAAFGGQAEGQAYYEPAAEDDRVSSGGSAKMVECKDLGSNSEVLDADALCICLGPRRGLSVIRCNVQDRAPDGFPQSPSAARWR